MFLYCNINTENINVLCGGAWCISRKGEMWRVYVECVLLMAGLQPHLAWVRLIGLWLGGAAHLWCMSNHGTQDKPAINTHTQEEPQPWQLPLARRIPSAWNSNKHLEPHLAVSCVGGPQGKPLRWRVVGPTLPHAYILKRFRIWTLFKSIKCCKSLIKWIVDLSCLFLSSGEALGQSTSETRE